MAQANLPISFWGDALLFTTYILNSIPSKFVPSTSYELWTSEKLDLRIMCPCDVQLIFIVLLMNMGNLVIGGKKCIFIRYSEFFKGYVFLEDVNGRLI